MQCSKLFCIPLFVFSLIGYANAQQIDETIARELGLVRSTSADLKSDVFDINLNVSKQTELVFPEQGTLDIKSEDTKKFEILNVNNSLFIQPRIVIDKPVVCLLYTSPSPRDRQKSRMPSSA